MNDELQASYRFCDELSRREAKNFYYSFRLLPRDRRASMTALYAFLRRTDDLADEAGSAASKKAAIENWRRSLDRAISEQSYEWPGLLALSDTVKNHRIPTRYLIDVIDGVEMDLTQTSYATFDDLYLYCYRVASAVGLSCLHIWGFDSQEGLAERLAEANGIALQLTNIIRDVREDAAQGRFYLPQEDLDRFGVARRDLEEGRMSLAVKELLAFESARSRQYYEQAQPLSALVDPVGRPVLATITGIYRELLDEIVRRDYNVLEGRVRVSGWKKAWITAHAWFTRSRSPSPSPVSSINLERRP